MAPGLLDAIKAMRSFVGTDASRQWSTGILLTGTHAYATNNVIAVEQAAWYEAIAESGLVVDDILHSLTVPYERWTYNVWAFQEIGRRNIGLTTTFKTPNMELF
jgi:hypothetical protein